MKRYLRYLDLRLVFLVVVVALAIWVFALTKALNDRTDDLESLARQTAQLTEIQFGLIEKVEKQSVVNCTTINENTTAVYQVALAFKALANILNGVPGALPPGGKLHAVVEDPEYLPGCPKSKTDKE